MRRNKMAKCLFCEKEFEGNGVLVATVFEGMVEYNTFCSMRHLALFFIKGHYHEFKDFEYFDEKVQE
jgi:hypothetical protein